MASNSQQVQRRDPEDVQILSTFVKGATTVIKKHPKITTGYVVGILCMIFASGFTVNQALRDRYDQTLEQIDWEAQKEAHNEMWSAKQMYDRHKGFFSCNVSCQKYKARYERVKATFDNLKREEASITSQAKSEVGILSEYGVQETRDMFWGTFAGGKDFAKRQSMWDLLFAGLRWGRDEDLFNVILRWLINLLFNFTLGLIGALGVFVFKLWGLISAYSPGPATAAVYFCLASCAATAFVATYLLVLYGAAAGSVAFVAKVAVDHNRRIANDPARRAQYLRAQQAQQGRRQHYE
mmetsp:Transcript_62322/g.140951  ORF Transcript_62322/g.140951 Transcript_62322/m.140951 type:complete len:295 (+) Transcript_62322:65-949(+)